jgi:hypothetical protein
VRLCCPHGDQKVYDKPEAFGRAPALLDGEPKAVGATNRVWAVLRASSLGKIVRGKCRDGDGAP